MRLSLLGFHLPTCHENHSNGSPISGIAVNAEDCGIPPPFNLRSGSTQKQSGCAMGKPMGARKRTVTWVLDQPEGSITLGITIAAAPLGSFVRVASGYSVL